jgi:hypothetical protein
MLTVATVAGYAILAVVAFLPLDEQPRRLKGLLD